MRDSELTNEPASNRRGDSIEVEWDTITQNNILDAETTKRFAPHRSLDAIFFEHMGSKVYRLTIDQEENALKRFAEIAMNGDYGYHIDTESGRIFIEADTEDEYRDAVSDAAIQLIDADSGYHNALQAYNESFDSDTYSHDYVKNLVTELYEWTRFHASTPTCVAITMSNQPDSGGWTVTFDASSRFDPDETAFDGSNLQSWLDGTEPEGDDMDVLAAQVRDVMVELDGNHSDR